MFESPQETLGRAESPNQEVRDLNFYSKYADRLEGEGDQNLEKLENELRELSKDYFEIRKNQDESRYHTLRGNITLRQKYLDNSTGVNDAIRIASFYYRHLAPEEKAAIEKRLEGIAPPFHSAEENTLEKLRLVALSCLPDEGPSGQSIQWNVPAVAKLEESLKPVEAVLNEVWRQADEDDSNHQAGLRQPDALDLSEF